MFLLSRINEDDLAAVKAVLSQDVELREAIRAYNPRHVAILTIVILVGGGKNIFRAGEFSDVFHASVMCGLSEGEALLGRSIPRWAEHKAPHQLMERSRLLNLHRRQNRYSGNVVASLPEVLEDLLRQDELYVKNARRWTEQILRLAREHRLAIERFPSS